MNHRTEKKTLSRDEAAKRLTQRHDKKKTWAVWLLLALMASAPLIARAGSITTAFAKVKIENLQPGQTYKVSKYFQPIIVINATDDPAQMTMELMRPQAVDLDPEFEPIPDVMWASLEKDRFDVPAWGEAVSDLNLTIPLDKEFWGKKYQLHIWTKATGGGNIGVGLMHKLLFTVAPEPDPEAAKKPADVLRFRVDPFEYFVKGVKFGRPIDLREQSGTAMVLKNPNNKKCRFRIEVIRFENSPILNLKEYDPDPPMEWLSVGSREVDVDGGKEYTLPLVLTLPRNPNFRNKKYLYLIRSTVLNASVPYSVISRVYVTTSERLLD